MTPTTPEAISSVNWWGILWASCGLAAIMWVYNLYTSNWAGREYRKGSAAPKASHTPLGGKSWWKSRVSVFPLVVLLCYLGTICLFVRSFWFVGLAVWWFASAAAVVWILWVKPSMDSSRARAAEKRKSETNGSVSAEFPRGDEADYVVVSPYEPLDSEKRPWWKPRR